MYTLGLCRHFYHKGNNMFPDCLKKYEKRYRATILVDVGILMQNYNLLFEKLMEEHNLRDDDFEDMYDWMVIEAFTNTHLIPHATVRGHYKHDVYKAAYDNLKVMFEAYLNNHSSLAQLSFKGVENVKAIVAGPNLIIVTQRNMYE